MSAAPTHEIEVLLFELAGTVFGVDASQVLRIDRSGQRPRARPEASTPLGKPTGGTRALVFRAPGGDAKLRVDAVRGVRRAPAAALRRLPPASGAPPYAIGVWLDEGHSVVLVDLVELHLAKGA